LRTTTLKAIFVTAWEFRVNVDGVLRKLSCLQLGGRTLGLAMALSMMCCLIKVQGQLVSVKPVVKQGSKIPVWCDRDVRTEDTLVGVHGQTKREH
jgi:hypothetical protein